MEEDDIAVWAVKKNAFQQKYQLAKFGEPVKSYDSTLLLIDFKTLWGDSGHI